MNENTGVPVRAIWRRVCQAVDQCRGGRNLSNLADERAHRRGLRGETTIAELLKHGDFGLGTFNHLDGELIAFDQEIHQLRADGSARPAGLQQKTPSPSSPFPAQRQPAIRPANHQGAAAPVHRRAGRLAEPVLRGAGRRRVQPRGNPYRAASGTALPPNAGSDRRAADLLVPSAARRAGRLPLARLHAGHRRGRLSRTLRYRRPQRRRPRAGLPARSWPPAVRRHHPSQSSVAA